MAERMIRKRLGDSGQISVLVIGFGLIVLLLLAVVVSASRVFLGQRDLSAAADAAAASAAQAVSEPSVYGQGTGTHLPLDPAAAAARVADYVGVAGLEGHFDDFIVVEVRVIDTSVSVTFAARAPMPFGGTLSEEWQDGYPITASATAHSPFG